MNFILTIIKRIMPKELSKPIGRWKIEISNEKINNKIDLANTDHCGTCGQFINNEQLNTKIGKATKKN